MARNPKQDANLKKGSPFRSAEEARIKGRKGGLASGKTRRAVRTFKELLIAGLTEEDMIAMWEAQKKNAKRGYLPSMEFIMKVKGEHPDQGTQANTAVHIVDDDPEGADYNA